MKKKPDNMFTAEMIAPCGLDCSLCRHAHDEEKPCPGCRGPEEDKYTYCHEICGIMRCDKLKENAYQFCDECPDYPCDDVMEKEERYMSKYPLKESPLENLQIIREVGMETFLEIEKEKWTCKKCGSPISVHTGVCTGCKES